MSHKTVLLVDGSSYLYRAFYGSSDLSTNSGEPTGAIFGVLSMLRRLLSKNNPDFFAVIFDPPGPTLRMDWYKDYKANRSKMPEELVAQVGPLKDIIRALGYPLIEVPGVEADDVMGTLALQGSTEGHHVFIVSGDKDMAQLVKADITVIDDQKDVIWDEQGVLAKFGVKPSQIVDYLTLIGDNSDNIPGVPKVGPKTAVKWLTSYSSLDSILENIHELKGKVGENLRHFVDKIPLTKKLVTIVTDVEIGAQVSDLKIKPANLALLRSFYEKYEFKTFLAELDDDFRSEDVKINDSTIQADYETLFTKERLLHWISKIKESDLFSFDLETTSLDPLEAEIVGLSVSVKGNAAAYIPLSHNYQGVPTQLDILETLESLKPILEDCSKTKVGHNLKYDYSVLKNYDISLNGIAFDTMLESYVFDSSVARHDMASVAARYLNLKTTSYEDVTGKGSSGIGFHEVEIEVATKYAAEDADVSLKIHHDLYPKIKRTGQLESLLSDIEVPLISVLAEMERVGVYVDSEMLGEQSKYLESCLTMKEEEVYENAGESFNIASPKQIQELLFDKLKLPIISKTPKGQPSTSESVLSELASEFALPRLILEHRSLSKLKSTYTDKLPTQISSLTGRIHTNYHQAVTTTGRLSSSDPNLQNIPVRTEEGRKIRKAFTASAGSTIVAADYSQIELRIMAHLSKDENLMGAFFDGADVHSVTASEVFGGSVSEVSSENRRAAKAINFGLIYGMSAFGLSKQLGISRVEAQEYISLYFERYPKVRNYMDSVRGQAKQDGFVETVFGRRLYLPNIRAKKARLRQYAERTAINAPMQGTAADIIKLAMINSSRWLIEQDFPATLIMQVHDELVFEVKSTAVKEISKALGEIMGSRGMLNVPLEVTIGSGDNWDEAH